MKKPIIYILSALISFAAVLVGHAYFTHWLELNVDEHAIDLSFLSLIVGLTVWLLLIYHIFLKRVVFIYDKDSKTWSSTIIRKL